MTRAHVRLLGPCFKTGRRGRRPTRDRNATRTRDCARYTRPPCYPPAAQPATRGWGPEGPQLHPRTRCAASGSSRQAAEKCSRRPGRPESRVLADPIPPSHPARSLNLRSQLRETPPFTTAQFHALLNSLFKVLFNFPSRYLFAIGLGVIFSLTWSLPRTLSCTPKQLDSRGKPAQRVDRLTGLSPSTGRGPSQGGL